MLRSESEVDAAKSLRYLLHRTRLAALQSKTRADEAGRARDLLGTALTYALKATGEIEQARKEQGVKLQYAEESRRQDRVANVRSVSGYVREVRENSLKAGQIVEWKRQQTVEKEELQLIVRTWKQRIAKYSSEHRHYASRLSALR